MTKDELWKVYADKNPSFNGMGNVTMSAAGLRKLFDQTWQQAHDQGVINGRALEKMEEKPLSAVDELFGKFRRR